MKTRYFIWLVLLLFSISVAGQGRIDSSGTHYSRILDRNMAYTVYLPVNYGNVEKQYPVLFLLHGMFGNDGYWVNSLNFKKPIDSLISAGQAEEMVIVMPDGLKDAFYINDYWDTLSWEDYFMKELIPEIDKKFTVRQDKKGRAIGGLSMGGYGALYYGFMYPEMFCAVYAMSPAVVEFGPMLTPESINTWEAKLAIKLYGPPQEDGYPPNYAKYCIQEIVKNMSDYSGDHLFEKSLPSITIEIGTSDFLLLFNRHLKQLMEEKNIPFEYIERPGGHERKFWNTALLSAVSKVSEAFKAPTGRN